MNAMKYAAINLDVPLHLRPAVSSYLQLELYKLGFVWSCGEGEKKDPINLDSYRLYTETYMHGTAVIFHDKLQSSPIPSRFQVYSADQPDGISGFLAHVKKLVNNVSKVREQILGVDVVISADYIDYDYNKLIFEVKRLAGQRQEELFND